MRTWSVAFAVTVLALTAVALALAPAGAAKRGDVLVPGRCTGSSTSKIKLSEENGRIEVELEVDQNRNGMRWSVTVFQNGRRIARMVRATRPPSGSFEARVVARNRLGIDAFRGRAVSRAGEVCVARASFS